MSTWKNTESVSLFKMSTCLVTSPAACHSHHISCTPLNMSGCVGVSFTVCRALHDILNRKLELKSKGMVQNCPKSARRKSDAKTTTQRTSTAPKLPGPIRKLSKATFMGFCEKLTGKAFKLPWFIILFPMISWPNKLFASSTNLRSVPVGLDAGPCWGKQAQVPRMGWMV